MHGDGASAEESVGRPRYRLMGSAAVPDCRQRPTRTAAMKDHSTRASVPLASAALDPSRAYFCLFGRPLPPIKHLAKRDVLELAHHEDGLPLADCGAHYRHSAERRHFSLAGIAGDELAHDNPGLKMPAGEQSRVPLRAVEPVPQDWNCPIRPQPYLRTGWMARGGC